MRRPWLRVGVFCGVALTVHLALAGAFGVALRGHKALRVDRLFEEHAPAHVEVLVTGDSHPRAAVDPRRVGAGAVNIALGGQHYLKAAYRTRALVESTGRTVGTLVLSADPSSFSGAEVDFAPEAVWGRYVDLLEVGRQRGEFWRFAGLWVKAHLVPYAGELRTLNQMRANRFGFGETLPGGSFAANPVIERMLMARFSARAHFRGDLPDPSMVWAFRELVAWARAGGTRVVLVAFPVTGQYDRHLAEMGVRDRVEEEVLAPLLAADPSIAYLDLHELFFAQPELFADPHHLNDRGRDLFSDHLRDLLAAPAPAQRTWQ